MTEVFKHVEVAPIIAHSTRHTEERQSYSLQDAQILSRPIEASTLPPDLQKFLHTWGILLVGELIQYLRVTAKKSHYTRQMRGYLQPLGIQPEDEATLLETWVPAYWSEDAFWQALKEPLPFEEALRGQRRSWKLERESRMASLLFKHGTAHWGELARHLVHGELRRGLRETPVRLLKTHGPKDHLRLGMRFPNIATWRPTALYTAHVAEWLQNEHAEARRFLATTPQARPWQTHPERRWDTLPYLRLLADCTKRCRHKYPLLDVLFYTDHDRSGVRRWDDVARPSIERRQFDAQLFARFGLWPNPSLEDLRSIFGDHLPSDWKHPQERIVPFRRP